MTVSKKIKVSILTYYPASIKEKYLYVTEHDRNN